MIDAKGPNNFTLRLFINQQTHLPIMVSWQGAPAGRGRGPMPAGARSGGAGPVAGRGAAPPAGAAPRRARRAAERDSGDGWSASGAPAAVAPPAGAPPGAPPAGSATAMRVTRRGVRLAGPGGRGAAPGMPAPVENRLYFADYREIDGLQFPFRLRRAVGPDTVEETTFDRFKINPEDRSSALREPKVTRARSGRAPESQAAMVTVLVALLTWSAAAQPARDARATITVVDQTGAVIPNATVTLTPLAAAGDAAGAGADERQGRRRASRRWRPATTRSRRSSPASTTGILKDVQLKAGDNKHVVVLALEGVRDSVTVSRDAREAASDRRSTFGTAMTREQIEALSDDPDEMAQQLQDLAGGNAVIRVDSFEGGRLPPKSAIKAIHITRDAFAAENHYAGGLFIDIITQPGIGPLRTNLQMRIRDGSLSGKNELRRTSQRDRSARRTTTAASAAR